MKPIAVMYTTSYFGIHLSKKQVQRLRRIATDQAIPYNALVKAYIQKGFANTERYEFSEGN